MKGRRTHAHRHEEVKRERQPPASDSHATSVISGRGRTAAAVALLLSLLSSVKGRSIVRSFALLSLPPSLSPSLAVVVADAAAADVIASKREELKETCFRITRVKEGRREGERVLSPFLLRSIHQTQTHVHTYTFARDSLLLPPDSSRVPLVLPLSSSLLLRLFFSFFSSSLDLFFFFSSSFFL